MMSGKIQKDNLPMFSFITPVLNGARYIEQSIVSVFEQQNYPKELLEYIAVDGGSSDGTLNILKRYEKKYNLHWISEKDSGVPEAFNKGYKMSSGNIINWLESDNYLMPDVLKSVVEVYKAGGNFIYGDVYWFFQEQDRYKLIFSPPQISFKYLLKNGNVLPPPTVFISRDLILQVGLPNKQKILVSDYDWWLRILKNRNTRTCYINKPLATYRVHKESLSKKNEYESIVAGYLLTQQYGGKFFYTPATAYYKFKYRKLSSFMEIYFSPVYLLVKKLKNFLLKINM